MKTVEKDGREFGQVQRNQVMTVHELALHFDYTEECMRRLLRKHHIRNASFNLRNPVNNKFLRTYFPEDVALFVRDNRTSGFEQSFRKVIQNDFAVTKLLTERDDIRNYLKKVIQGIEDVKPKMQHS